MLESSAYSDLSVDGVPLIRRLNLFVVWTLLEGTQSNNAYNRADVRTSTYIDFDVKYKQVYKLILMLEILINDPIKISKHNIF